MYIPFEYRMSDSNSKDVIRYRRKEGRIFPIRFDREPYECSIMACGHSYHLIFGSQANGHFLCIPDWHTGCELVSYDDSIWNINSLMMTDRFSYDAASAIIAALSTVNELLLD